MKIVETIAATVSHRVEQLNETADEPRDLPIEGKKREAKPKTRINVLHCDIIQDEFWFSRPSILTD